MWCGLKKAVVNRRGNFFSSDVWAAPVLFLGGGWRFNSCAAPTATFVFLLPKAAQSIDRGWLAFLARFFARGGGDPPRRDVSSASLFKLFFFSVGCYRIPKNRIRFCTILSQACTREISILITRVDI